VSIRSEVQTRLQEDSTRLTTAQIDELVVAALRELSHDYPRKIMRSFEGDDGRKYPLVSNGSPAVTAAFAGYVQGLSTVLQLSTEEGSEWLEIASDEWYVEDDEYAGAPSVWLPTLWLSADVPAGEFRRVMLTTTRAEADPDMAGRILEAAIMLTLAKSYQAIASEYAAMTDSTYLADSVNRQELVRSWLDLHDVSMRSYRKLVGLLTAEAGGAATSSVVAASVTRDWTDSYPTQGRGVRFLRRGYN